MIHSVLGVTAAWVCMNDGDSFSGHRHGRLEGRGTDQYDEVYVGEKNRVRHIACNSESRRRRSLGITAVDRMTFR